MYTVWDAYAIGLLDLSPVSYFWGAELCRTALLAPLALPRSLALRRVRRDERRIVLWVGPAGGGCRRRSAWSVASPCWRGREVALGREHIWRMRPACRGFTLECPQWIPADPTPT